MSNIKFIVRQLSKSDCDFKTVAFHTGLTERGLKNIRDGVSKKPHVLTLKTLENYFRERAAK